MNSKGKRRSGEVTMKRHGEQSGSFGTCRLDLWRMLPLEVSDFGRCDYKVNTHKSP